MGSYQEMKDKRPIITWLYNAKGWAFSKIANELIEHLPSFRHMRIFKDRMKHTNMKKIYNISDIVVIFHPYDVLLFERMDNTVVRLDSYRGVRQCKLV